MDSKRRSSAGAGIGAALVPKLRFPEFRDAAGWRRIALESVCEILNNRRRPITSNERTPGPYPYYGASGIVDYVGDYIFDERLLLVGEDGAKWGAFEATAFIAEGQYWVNNHAHVLKPISANDTFLENYLTMLDLGPFVTGAAPPKLTLGKLKSIPIPLPPSSTEQQKIADCLDSADALIAAQGRKVEALRAHKKGLMQQLFPQEGETQPRLRFPEFGDAGEWSQTDLGRLIEIKGRIGYRGYTVEDIVDAGEGAIALSPSNISETGSLSFEKATFISWLKYNESPEIMVEKGQTLLVKTGSTYGKCAFVRDLPQECTVNPQIVVLKPISVDPYFLSLLIAGEGLQSKIEANVVGGAIPTLSQDSISKFKVLVPKLSEQQRIADCLTALDDLIAAETRKHDTLKTHKRGLMQQLFLVVGEDDA